MNRITFCLRQLLSKFKVSYKVIVYAESNSIRLCVSAAEMMLLKKDCPDLSEEALKEEVLVYLLASLQQRQEAETKALISIMPDQVSTSTFNSSVVPEVVPCHFGSQAL